MAGRTSGSRRRDRLLASNYDLLGAAGRRCSRWRSDLWLYMDRAAGQDDGSTQTRTDATRGVGLLGVRSDSDNQAGHSYVWVTRASRLSICVGPPPRGFSVVKSGCEGPQLSCFICRNAVRIGTKTGARR